MFYILLCPGSNCLKTVLLFYCYFIFNFLFVFILMIRIFKLFILDFQDVPFIAIHLLELFNISVITSVVPNHCLEDMCSLGIHWARGGITNDLDKNDNLLTISVVILV